MVFCCFFGMVFFYDSFFYNFVMVVGCLLMLCVVVLVGLVIVFLMVIVVVVEWILCVYVGMVLLCWSSMLCMLGVDEYRVLVLLCVLVGCDYDDQIKWLCGVFIGGVCWNSFLVGEGLLGGVFVLVLKQVWFYFVEDNEVEVVLGKCVVVVVCFNGFIIVVVWLDVVISCVCGECLEMFEEVLM